MRVARRNKHWVWCTSFLDTDVTPGAFSYAQLVTASDWTGVAGLDECTLTRIRGSFGWWVASGYASFTAWIVVVDFNSTVTDPQVIGNWASEDILWTKSAGLASPNNELNYDIDVKVKRRLKSSQDVRFVWGSSAAGSIRGVARSLVQLAG